MDANLRHRALGVTDTNALQQIPGYEKIMEVARQRNPNRRLTQPEDVARCIAALCHPATYWLTGNTLHVTAERTS